MPVDPSAVKTWANLVTVARILIAPFMFLLIPDHPGGRWVAFLLWFFLCSSDGIDGYLARRHGATTLGAFLDPLADKVLVLGAMCFAAPRAAQTNPFLGAWNISGVGPDNARVYWLELKEEAGTITGLFLNQTGQIGRAHV